MKTKVTYYLILLFLLCKTATAQIEFSVTVTDVKCNNSAPGKITVTIITPTHPPYTFLWSTGQTTDHIDDLAIGNYTVTITDADGKDTSATIPVQEKKCEMDPEIIFTPNSDGHNDTWFIANAQYFPDAWVLVYNRLGQKVFEHKGLYEPWDGKDLLSGNAPDATYYYIVYEDKSDEKTIKKGSVSIIR